jgi:hypothetical protein
VPRSVLQDRQDQGGRIALQQLTGGIQRFPSFRCIGLIIYRISRYVNM